VRPDVRPTRYPKVNNKLPTIEGVQQFKCQLFKNKKGGTHLSCTKTNKLLFKRETVFLLFVFFLPPSFLLFLSVFVSLVLILYVLIFLFISVVCRKSFTRMINADGQENGTEAVQQ
jgi:Ca2+/Na+ antiporter